MSTANERPEQDGMSRNQAAAHFGVPISAATTWVKLFRQTGRLAHGQRGGHKPKKISGGYLADCAASSERYCHDQ